MNMFSLVFHNQDDFTHMLHLHIKMVFQMDSQSNQHIVLSLKHKSHLDSDMVSRMNIHCIQDMFLNKFHQYIKFSSMSNSMLKVNIRKCLKHRLNLDIRLVLIDCSILKSKDNFQV